jgi:hypothetical protein
MSEHKSEELGHELKKAVDDAKSFQKELSQMRPESSSKVTVSVSGTIGGGGSGTSACTVSIKGDKLGDAGKIATGLKQKFPSASCTAEKDLAVTCTIP